MRETLFPMLAKPSCHRTSFEARIYFVRGAPVLRSTYVCISFVVRHDDNFFGRNRDRGYNLNVWLGCRNTCWLSEKKGVMVMTNQPGQRLL